MPHECVETDLVFAKSRNAAVIRQCPELAVIGTIPESMTIAAIAAAPAAIAPAVRQRGFTASGSLGARMLSARLRAPQSSHDTNTRPSAATTRISVVTRIAPELVVRSEALGVARWL